MNGLFTFASGDLREYQPYLYSINLNSSFSISGIINSGEWFTADLPADLRQLRNRGAFMVGNSSLYVYPPASVNGSVAVHRAYDVRSSSWGYVEVEGVVADRNLTLADLIGEITSLKSTFLI